MKNGNRTAVLAVFPTRGRAETAIDTLLHAGFAKEHLGMIGPGGKREQIATYTEETEEKAAGGALAGAVTGGTLGALAGAVAVGAIPGVGPVIAGGLLAGILTGAAAGAALGSFAGPFVAMGFPKEEVQHYEAEFRAGKTIVVVREEEGREQEAATILSEYEPTRIKIVGSQPVASPPA